MSHPDSGAQHLAWIARFQIALLILGAPLWLLRSWKAALAFTLGGLLSVMFWQAHRFLVTRMLTPSLRLRWLYAALTLTKLALITLGLRAIMACLPGSAVPLAVGILLFVGGILLEAGRLIFQSPTPLDDPEHRN